MNQIAVLLKKAPQALKAIIAFLIPFSAWATAALQDGKISTGEWWELAGVLATPLAVYIVPNSDPTPPVVVLPPADQMILPVADSTGTPTPTP